MIRIDETIDLNCFTSCLWDIWWNLLSSINKKIIYSLKFTLNILITDDTLITGI